MQRFNSLKLAAIATFAFLVSRSTLALPPIATGPFVAAGHYIQEFDLQSAALVGNVTTSWIDGTSNTELHFGPDNNLYGLGSNSWVYKYDFLNGQTSVFFKPTGDLGASGLARGPDLNWYIAAGHYIQKVNPNGVFLSNVTTSWNDGSGNTELHFGPDNNIYGLGSNGWVFKYDFTSGLTSIFAKPTGDLGSTGLALGPDLNWYVAAGHYIQKFSQTGAFLGNVTTSWAAGTSNTELHFGPDNNLYGLGSNGWVFKYDFANGQTSIFAKPTGDLGSTGLAFPIPEPNVALLLFAGASISICCWTRSPMFRKRTFG